MKETKDRVYNEIVSPEEKGEIDILCMYVCVCVNVCGDSERQREWDGSDGVSIQIKEY